MQQGKHFFYGLQRKLFCSCALAIIAAVCCFICSITVLQGPPGVAFCLLLFLGICTFLGSSLLRKFVSRLQSLMTAANQWSQGDFSFTVQDEDDDEFGQLTQRLNEMAHRLELLFAVQQENIAAEERNRLARDLHDCIKQEFFALGAQLQIANELYLQPQRLQTHLQQATSLLQSIQEEMNNLIQHLRPAPLAQKGLVHALQDYAQSWSQLSGIHTLFIHDLPDNENVVSLTPQQEEALFRVMQEALSNIARHSAARYVEVRLSSNLQEAILSIADNGCGFDLAHVKPGIGTHSMQERFLPLGGTVKINSTPGQGTTIVASLPLQPALITKELHIITQEVQSTQQTEIFAQLI